MKTRYLHSPQQELGIAHVEFALILPLIVLLLGLVVFFGRVFWHYSVAVKTASDIATFVALSRSAEMLEARPDLGEIAIIQTARSIGTAELAELNPGNDTRPVVDITCDGATCRGAAIPNEIQVLVQMRMYAPFMPEVLSQLGDLDGMWLRAEVRVRYAGA
jgi:hypothetical protein